jgi:5-methylcytosine-specific restriction enzyme A
VPRLTALKPRLGSLPPRIGYQPGDEKARDKHRSATQHWRQWYKSTRWSKLRIKVFIRDHFTCQMCGRIDGNTSRLVGDHRIPHRGDEAAFFDEANVQTLCKPCHDSDKQRQERRNGF